MTAPNTPPIGQSLDELRKRFAVPGVTFEPGEGGLLRAVASTEAAEAHVYLHGAHVTRFQPRGQADLMFMSGKSLFAPGKAIRGGVPLIFPWFGAKAGDPSAPAHGLVRSSDWAMHDVSAAGQGADRVVRLTFALNSDAATKSRWPHDFELLYAVTVGRTLQLDLEVRNPPGASGPFTFEEALHTYLAVGDARKVSIDGLGGRDYIDKPDGFKRKTQPPGPFGIDSETDRVYLATPDAVMVTDPIGPASESGQVKPRVLTVSKENSAATVVWNPWIAKAKAMSDFGDDEWPGMLCVETANVDAHAITLAPGKSHAMRAVIQAE
jgi:glucose-6-phosphate 1-epimerase